MELKTENILDELDALVNDWCELRHLHALSVVLPSTLRSTNRRRRWQTCAVALEHGQRLTAEAHYQVKHLLDISGGALRD